MSLFRRTGVPLSAFVRGLVKSLCDAQQAIPHAREEALRCHMDVDPDDPDLLHPKTERIQVAPDHILRLPTYALSQVNTIGITRAQVKCYARIADLTECDQCGTLTCGKTQIRFAVNPAYEGDRRSISIDLTFEARDPVETEELLVEALNATIRPDD